MATPGSASVQSSSYYHQPRSGAVAWTCSLGIHLVVVLIVSRTEWSVQETEPPPVVVWLYERPLSEPPRSHAFEAEPVEAEEQVARVARALQPEAAVRGVEVVSPGEAAERGAPRPEAPEADVEEAGAREPDTAGPAATETETPAPARETETPAPARESGERRPSRTYVVRNVDWDEERRRAIEQLSEEMARVQGYRTFALDDVIESPQPEEPGQPTGEIFEARSSDGGRSFLTPGRSGGPIGRKITAFCDVIGGIGLGLNGFSLGSICAEEERFSLFAHLKPSYMRARPVCTRTPGAEAPHADGPGDPTAKCRLVMEGEAVVPDDMPQAATVPSVRAPEDAAGGTAIPPE